MSAAELSIALRIQGATRTTTQAALWESRGLIKTYGPRGTLHLLPADQYAMWVGALSAMPAVPSSHRKDVRLSAEQTDQVVGAVAAALADRELTIDELGEAVVELTGPWAGELTMPAFGGMWPRWRQALGQAGVRGALCFAPNRGRQVTYTNPRRWLGDFSPEPGPRALERLVRQYLHAYGPATPEQFARWLAMSPRWATELFASLGARVETAELEGRAAFVVAGDRETPDEPPPAVALLPYFDAYAIAAGPRELLFPGRAFQRALSPAGQAGNYPVLLIDGLVAGVWHHRLKGRRVEVTVEPLGRLTAAARRGLDDEVERLAFALEARPSLTVGAVSVGPHA